jgi:hypothetical protein
MSDTWMDVSSSMGTGEDSGQRIVFSGAEIVASVPADLGTALRST